MRYLFMEKMNNKAETITSEKLEADKQPSKKEVEKSEGGSGKKRRASDTLEHNITKVAKTAAAAGAEGIVTEEAEQVQDPRDEEMAKLKNKLSIAKTNISSLQDEVEELEEKLADNTCRVHELEAREHKRIEKEKVVETDMHARMKDAFIKMRAELKAEFAEKEKDLKEQLKVKKENHAAKLEHTWKTRLDEANAKAKKKEKELQDKLKSAESDHKEELKDLNAKHKEAVKNLRPEHSNAMKEKAKELKAKDKTIADLQKNTKEIDSLMAEKEEFASEVKAQEAKNSGLRIELKKEQERWKKIETQYNSKLEHEGRRWQLQNNQAVEAKRNVILQQRSNFALRADRDVKNDRIRQLEGELEVARDQSQKLSERILQQSASSTLQADCDAKENETRELEGDSQSAQMLSQSSNGQTCFERSISMNHVGATPVGEENDGASTTDLSSAPTPSAVDGEANDVVEATGGSAGAE